MKLGISTACFYPMPIEDTLPLIHQAGFTAAELFLNCAGECTKEFAREMSRRAKDLGIEVISVHSFTSAVETFLLFSSYERRTKEGIDTLKTVMDTANELGAKFITFHGKRIGVGERTGEEYYCEVLARLMREAELRGVVLAQENVSWCESASPEFLERIQEKLGRGKLKFTLDVKQAKRALRDIEDYMAVMGENIVNVHVNDFDAESGCLLPGRGAMDFRAFARKLKALSYDGALVTEVYSHDFEGVLDLRESRALLEREILA